MFAKQVGRASLVQGPITNWQRAMNRGWINFQANVTVLDFQDLKDATMASASVPGTLGILKPVVVGTVTDCC